MADDHANLGHRIGPYRLIEVLGEGGMGVVYRAEQTSPIHREVALKLVPLGMNTSSVIARFESERQALAMMNHPYIAQALEAAAAEDGRPYFVMELVRGEPVTDYCAREKPPLSERLKLFLQICEAIQHAHQRGIIHRDLKPSNVLVTKQGAELVPKVIDFGIAKAIGEADARELLSTIEGQTVGTPEYMSPEQAGAIEAGLDTRTDVYSLGVMLYELVSGTRPYELTKRTAIELERALRTPPAAPGFGDIDAVALMAMERLPDDRYSSVAQLADDVRRVLAHRPVRARTQTWTYRAQKFVRRNAATVATAALVIVLIFTGAIGIISQRNRAIASELRAVSEAARARAEAEKASEVSRFLIDLFRESDPVNARGASVTARELLDRAANRLSTELASQDAVRATLMDTIGVVYRQLGLGDEAEQVANDALAIRRRVLGPEHPDVAQSLDNIGQLFFDRSKYDVAVQYHRDALAMRQKLLGPNHLDVAQSQNNLALALQAQGKNADAEPVAQEALRIRRDQLGPDAPETLITMSVLGHIADSAGRFADAERYYRQVLDVRRKILPANHPRLAISINSLAGVVARGGRAADAEPLFREALAIRRTILEPHHPDLNVSLNDLASCLHDLGRLEDAEPLYREALEGDRRQYGGRHMGVAIDLNNLASLLEERGKLDEAGRMFEESLALRIALQGETHPSVATVLNNIGRLRMVQGRLGDSERALRRSIDIRKSIGQEKHARTADSMVSLGRVLQARGRLTDAEAQYAGALAIQRAASPSGSPGTASALMALGHVKMVGKDTAAAEPLLREALAFRRQSLPAGHWIIANAEAGLGECLLRQARWPEAETLLVSALKSIPTGITAAIYNRKKVLELLVTLYDASGKRDEAARYRALLQAK
jgi:tetratricopeptide (TPR) repeat protein